MSIEFRSKVYPALTVVHDGRRWKFAGGRLEVPAGEASSIREYAKARPHLGIEETAAPEAPVASGEDSTPDVEEPTLNHTKAQLLDLAEARGLDRAALEPHTKVEIIKAMKA